MKSRDIEIQNIKSKFRMTYHADDKLEERWWKLYFGKSEQDDIFESIMRWEIYRDTRKHNIWTYRVIGFLYDYVLWDELYIVTLFKHDAKLREEMRPLFRKQSPPCIADILWLRHKPNIKSIWQPMWNIK